MKELTITITGKTTDDLIQAMQEVFKLVGDDFISGFDKNETGGYSFEVDEEDETRRLSIGDEVFWTDPEELISNWGRIAHISGDGKAQDGDTIYTLTMCDGGVVEATFHELKVRL